MVKVLDRRRRLSSSPMANDADCMAEAIQRLCDTIEVKMGYGMSTPTDFKCAAEAVTARTGRPISATTMMRIWGYLRDTGANYRPTRYSLSTLALYLGYLDFDRFAAQSTKDGEAQAGKPKLRKNPEVMKF